MGAGNVSKQQRDTLQNQADKLRGKVFDAKGNLKVSHGSKDLKNFQRIQQILDKMKTVEEAKRLQ